MSDSSTARASVGNASALRLEAVSKSFQNKRKRAEILRSVDLVIQKGEFVCVLGESGCGKSTLLKLIAGLDKCTSGSVFLNGQTVRGPSFARCLMFQKPSLFPWLSVRKNVSLGLDIRGGVADKDRRVAEAISLVGLAGYEEYLPSQLSGGMAQRVALARALINEPEVLLLDEPFGALDAVTRERMQEELLRIWSERTFTNLFVTHDIDEAILLATRIVLLAAHPGRIEADFKVSLTHPRARTSREFLSLRAEVSEKFLDSIQRKLPVDQQASPPP